MATDKFANIATIEVTASAANTLTFQALQTGLGIRANRKSADAMIVDQIDYFPAGNSIAEMTTTSDQIAFALTISNAVGNLEDITDRRTLHSGSVRRLDFGTAAGGQLVRLPFRHQFFPPLITAEATIYLGTLSSGLASANVLRCRIYYRVVELSQGEFLELAEVFRLVR